MITALLDLPFCVGTQAILTEWFQIHSKLASDELPFSYDKMPEQENW